MFVREYSYTVTEHDPERPWIVQGQGRRTVQLEDGLEFFEWARHEWPRQRFSVLPGPTGCSPAGRSSDCRT